MKLGREEILITEKWFQNSFNGIFKKDDKKLAYARVERTEKGLSFTMLRLMIGMRLEDLTGSKLHLYHRRDNDLIEVVDITHPLYANITMIL
jgi:hypothetical protein